VDDERPRWHTLDVDMWRGQRTYLQFVDLPAADPAEPHRPGGYGPDGWIAVGAAVLSDDRSPPRRDPAALPEWLGRAPPSGAAELAQRYASALDAAIRSLREGRPAVPPAVALLGWIGAAGLLQDSDGAQAALRALAAAEAQLPDAFV